MKLRLCAVVLMLAALPASAQNSPGGLLGNAVGSMLSPMLNLMIEPVVTGEPFTATRIITTTSKLQDGTTITHHGHRMLVRDNEGRVRMQQFLVKATDKDPGVKMVYIKDPVAGTLTMWAEGGKGPKVATVIKLPDLSKDKTLAAKSAAKPATGPDADLGDDEGDADTKDAAADTKDAAADLKKDDVKVDDLGQQSIDGLLTTGKRTTHVIPAGRIGNDQPITRTNEVWISPELRLVVKSVNNDPRAGETTTELENFSRENPPMSAFQPPAGYVVKTQEEIMKDVQAKAAAAQQQHP